MAKDYPLSNRSQAMSEEQLLDLPSALDRLPTRQTALALPKAVSVLLLRRLLPVRLLPLLLLLSTITELRTESTTAVLEFQSSASLILMIKPLLLKDPSNKLPLIQPPPECPLGSSTIGFLAGRVRSSTWKASHTIPRRTLRNIELPLVDENLQQSYSCLSSSMGLLNLPRIKWRRSSQSSRAI